MIQGSIFSLFVGDRKSTRLNSSHLGISYAVFCLKKKILALFPTAALPPRRHRNTTAIPKQHRLAPLRVHFRDGSLGWRTRLLRRLFFFFSAPAPPARFPPFPPPILPSD